ncbi:hypothetical protein [Nocardia sp. NPDC051463]|uniref:hypothetical protein n=1 Tax=Nocardia sp. NPDC051463 TaxID=3154845 RepID=UPI003415873A
MSNRANLVSEQTVTLAMDYGQFLISGGAGDENDRSDYYEVELLDRAMASQPRAGDGITVLVLSPHQNNFAMAVTVQVWDARPPADRDAWQQVCEARLQVGDVGALFLESPTLDMIVAAQVPEGTYLLEVSGTGFLNYGWPGSTTPGDSWRIRLWPDDGSDPLPPQLWSMPGYGVPENIPIPQHPLSTFDGESTFMVETERSPEMNAHIELEAHRHALPETTRERQE